MQVSKESYFGLGRVPIGIGAVINGWNISEKDFHNPDTLNVVDFRGLTTACAWDCFHCFTGKLEKNLTLEEIKRIIGEAAELKAKAINFLGEGEPTLDKDFFEVIEYAAAKGVQAVVFTDAATKMRDKKFVERVFESGASVCPKCDSLWNAEYQNWVVGDKEEKFFGQRKQALELLMETGFNAPAEDGTTRLGFDMVLSKRNFHEVEKTLRFCRENNLFICFTTFLPAGRSAKQDFAKDLVLSQEELQQVRDTVKKIDWEEYNFHHVVQNNFATMSCVELMQIFGDGSVSPCPGNETRIGNIRDNTIKELYEKILEKYPKHNLETFDGNCLYRPRM